MWPAIPFQSILGARGDKREAVWLWEGMKDHRAKLPEASQTQCDLRRVRAEDCPLRPSVLE